MYKTWANLLGTDLTGIELQGRYIVRAIGTPGRYTVVYQADDHVMAARILQQLKNETTKEKIVDEN